MFSGPIPTRVNHRKLATEKRKLEGTIPLVELERLLSVVNAAADNKEGEIEVNLSFRKGRYRAGLMVGRASGDVLLQCQSCMQPVKYRIEAQYRHLLLASEEQLAELEDEEDGIVCDGEMVAVAELIEDELLLALPMVARHENGQCQSDDYHFEDDQPEEPEVVDTYKPFAGLAEQLKGNAGDESTDAAGKKD